MDVKIFFFFQSFFPQDGGTRKDVKHGSKVKGNTKKELTQLTMGAAGKDPKALTLFIKVNITVTLHTLKSLALVSGKCSTCLCSTGSSREDRHLLRPLFFFVCFFLLEALPTCVIVWPLSACLLRSAVLCSSPHPAPPFARRLPADPFRLASLLFLPQPPPFPPGLQAKSSSFRTGPPVLNLLLLLRQSLSSATSLFVSLLQGSL